MRWKEITEGQLNELFDNSVPITWRNPQSCSFEVDGKTYNAAFPPLTPEKNDLYEFIFSTRDKSSNDPRFDNTGSAGSSAIKVFSTVVEILKTFLSQVKPDGVYFSGSKSDGRDHLYIKMVRSLGKYLNDLGYTVRTEDGSRDLSFYIDKQDAVTESQHLNELFKNTVPIEWQTSRLANFVVNGIRFRAMFSDNYDNNYEFSFLSYDSDNSQNFMKTGKSGSSAVQVFSACAEILKTYLQKSKPASVYFTGNKHSGKAKLYGKLVHFLRHDLDSLGYDVKVIDVGSSSSVVKYLLTRKDLSGAPEQ